MHEFLITSASNPLIKELRALSQKKVRDARGEFLAEGIQIVLRAAQTRAPIKLLVVAPDLLTSRAARELVRTQEHAGTRIVRVSRAAFESFAERDHPSGLAAVVQITSRALDSLQLDSDALFVVLHQVSNPGNLGAILRTADAVAARGVILLGTATDLYAPAAVKASRGALFTVPCVRVRAAQEFLDWARRQALRLVTTSDAASQEFWRADLRPPLALLFGNEGEGLPDNLLHAGEAVRIPMSGQVDSLNLACAASVLLYEVQRQQEFSRNG
jgi:TrmH family RNA methyltransferase